MNRREFITLAGGAAAWPVAARGQQADNKLRRVGVLTAQDNAVGFALMQAFQNALLKRGWTPEVNVRFDIRRTKLDMADVQQMANELVMSAPDVIFSSNTVPTAALKRATETIPIVFGNVVDPVGSGFVASLARPGGNVTGFVNLEGSVAGKYVELLKELVPNLKKVAIYFNPLTAPRSEIYLKPFYEAAAIFGIEPVEAPFHDIIELESVFSSLAQDQNSAVIAMPDGFNTSHAAEEVALAARFRLPAVYSGRQFCEFGGLMSYGNDLFDNYQRAAGYVDRILNGEKPRDLPVQFPVKFELVINLKTANALGISVSPGLQQLADDIIE